MSGIKILGTGSYMPVNRIDNAMLEAIVDTSDEWIRTRTGIESRCFASGESNLYMASTACSQAIQSSGIDKGEITVVICATITGDYLTPSLSCCLQKELDLPQNALFFDINAACSGFVYALDIAHALLQRARKGYALIVGSEMLSRVTDFTDRNTCVLFGDGAGAAVISLSDDRPFFFDAGAKGDCESLSCPSGAAGDNPFYNNTAEKLPSFIHMNGQEVFRFAVESMVKSVNTVLEQAGIAAGDIDWLVCHQANARIITAASKKLDIPIEKFFMNIATHGNTSSASIPLALDEMNSKNLLRRGDKIILAGFGGGLTYGTAYLIW